MSYVVLARKYRPMGFTDLVGQDHVARILAGAIASGRVAHAFLFTGVRGVGKTTSARILAKALNCMGDPATTERGVDPGPTAAPCLKCPACLEIADGKDVDVLEIDGASNSGVDEVRRLQDNLPYRPQRDRFKIVIVDEVHMLSTNAWNAFLKTLEEPPPHVKFIFATTEVHKVPVTILSRVQRFDFKLIGSSQIAARLRDVLSNENIRAEERALSIIAREAAGSMRDAMSLLDQVIAFGDTELTGESVAEVLGVASHQVLHDIARALVEGDAARCLTIVGSLAERGHDIAHVTRDLLALLRDLVVAKVVSDPKGLLDLPGDELLDVQALASAATSDDLLRLHQGFSRGYDEVVRGAQPRAALEMLLVRLARRPPLVPIDDLLERLSGLERRLSGARGAAAPPGRPGGAPPPNRPRSRDVRSPSPGGLAAPERSDEPPGRVPSREETQNPAARAVAPLDPPGAQAPERPQPELRERPAEPAAPSERAAPSEPAAPSERAAPSEPAAAQPDVAPRIAQQPESLAPRAEPPPAAQAPVPRGSDFPAAPIQAGAAQAPRGAPQPPTLNPYPGAVARPVPGSVPPPPSSVRPGRPSRDAADVDLAQILANARRLPPPEPAQLEKLTAFRELLAPLRAERADLAAVLNHAILLELSAERIVLGFDRHTVFRGRADSAESKAAILTHSQQYFGREPELRFEFELPQQTLHTLATLDAERREQERLEAIDSARNHPLVKAAERLLGARVKRILPYE